MKFVIAVFCFLLVACSVSSQENDFPGTGNMTPEEKAKFNELYEKALKEGNLLEFLKNYTSGKTGTGNGQTGTGQTSGGKTGGGKTGGGLTGDRKTCFQKSRKLERQAQAAGKTFDRKAAAMQCLKELAIQKIHKESCEKETAEAKAVAQGKNQAFQEKEYLEQCLKRPLPTDLPATTREPKTNVNQKCQEALAELVKAGKEPADKLAFHDTCVQELKKRRECYRKLQEANKTTSDVQKKQYIKSCIKQASSEAKRDLLQPTGLTNEEKARFNELYEKALREGNLVEFLKSYVSGKPMKKPGAMGGNEKQTGDRKSSKKACDDEVEKKKKEAAENKRPFDAEKELKACYKTVKLQLMKKKLCLNETAEARAVAESQNQPFDAEQYMKNCLNRPTPTTAPKPTKPPKPTDMQECQLEFKTKQSAGTLKAADEKSFIQKCVLTKKARKECVEELRKASKEKSRPKKADVKKCMTVKLAALRTTSAATRSTSSVPTSTSQATRPTTQAQTRSSTPMPTRLSTRLSTRSPTRPTV